MRTRVDSDWHDVRIGELARIRRGASPRPIEDPRWFAADGPGWVRISDVTRSKGHLVATEQKLSSEGASRSVHVGHGDVIMSICATIGEPIMIAMDACIHDGFVVFDEFIGKLDREFLLHLLRFIAPKLKAQGQTGTQANINTGIVGGYKVRVPQCVGEQIRIARILDTADVLIGKSEGILAKLRQIRSGLLQDLLTRGLDADGCLRDPAAHPEQFKDSPLGRIPQEWEIDLLVNRISFPEGQVDPRYAPYNGYTLIAPDHIESETGRQLASVTAEEQGAISGKYLFQAGDVLYSKIRPYLRKALLAQETGLCSADMYPLRPREGVNANYLLAVILGEDFSRFASAVSMRSGFPKINRQEMAGYRLAWPPSKEQNAIATHLANHDRLIAAEQSEISKLRQLKSGLMTDLLEGRVRVPDEARQVNPDDYPRGGASGRS